MLTDQFSALTGSIPMGTNGTTYQMTLTLKGGTLSLTFNMSMSRAYLRSQPLISLPLSWLR